MNTFIRFACLACLAAAAPARAEDAAVPKEREYSYTWDMLDHSLVRPVTRVLDPGLWVRRIASNPREAANVGADDQVRLPSTWWQPRIGFRPVSVEQMLAGPGDGKGPAPGRWTVTKAKAQGVTAGFEIRDSKGSRFVIKFDPPDYPELTTGADVIGSYLFWAAGYNVPENTIAIVRAESLDIDPKATFKDVKGRKHPITREFLSQLLARVARQRDGGYRAIASRYLEGKPLGPFEYRGRRSDDPEDLIPHELRRELRGLWAIAAWTNHADSRGPNSLDMWVTDNGRSFVRHHLIDFSAILGSSSIGSRSLVTGTEYYVDAKVMAASALTLGLKPFAWEGAVDPEIRSVGAVEAVVFDPVRWKPDYPNPAFDERTPRDVRWGARIVSGFTDEHIRAAVKAARYSDSRASEYLIQVLIQRRDKIARAWLPHSGDKETVKP